MDVLDRLSEERDRLDDREVCRAISPDAAVDVRPASGSGKSSLLKAGVLPRLGAPDWVVLPTLRMSAADAEQTIFDQLAREVASLFPNGSQSAPDWKQIRDRLRNDDAGAAATYFSEVTQDLTMALDRKDATVLLSIDQFEEFLAPAAGTDAEKFLRFMQAAFARRNCRLLGVGTMRSDYLDIYEKHRFATKAPFFYSWRLGLFPRDRILEIISRPAERGGLKIADDLLECLKKDTPNSEALPLLAFTLEKLCRRSGADGLLEREEYRELGGMEGAIQKSIEGIIPTSLPNETLNALRLSFVKHLAQVNDKGEVVRLTANWSDLPAEARPILGKFVEERLLVKSEGERLEVAHEAMFRCWDTLKAWLQASGEVMRWRRDVRRDRASDGTKWRGLRPAQLAVARNWLKTRDQELDGDEIQWIKRGILRQRLVRGLGLSVLLTISVLGIVAAWQWQLAERSTKQAKRNEWIASHNLALNHIEIAISELESGNLQLGIFRLWQAYHDAKDDDDLRASARNLIGSWSQRLLPPLIHGDRVNAVAFAPDGQTVLTGSDDKTARLWDAKTGKPMGEPLSHGDRVGAVAYSPDGLTLLTCSLDGVARIWETRTCTPIGEPISHGRYIHASSFAPNGKTILTGSSDGTARIWDANTGKPIGNPMNHGDPVTALAFSPDGQTILTACNDGTIRLWETSTGKQVGELMKQSRNIGSVAFAPNGQVVLTGSQDGTARLWDARTGKPLGEPMRHGTFVLAVAFSPDGQIVVTGSADGTARFWDAKSGTPLGQPMKHGGYANAIAFAPDGQTVLTGSSDGKVRLWETKTGISISEPMKHESFVSAVAFGPDGQTILTGSWDHNARLWKPKGEKPLGLPMKHEDRVCAVAFAPDGQTILTGSCDHTARLWDTKSGKPIGDLMKHDNCVWAVAYAPDGQTILTGSEDHTARLWDAKSGKPVGEPMKHEEPIRVLTFAPNGQAILTGSLDRTARLWDAKSGKPVGEPMKHDGSVTDVAFSPDGQVVLTGSSDEMARFWDAKTGKPLGYPIKCHGCVMKVAFSPDGRNFLTSNDEGIVCLWDAKTSNPLGEPMKHFEYVNAMAFAPDGQSILTGCVDGTARLWDAKTGKPLTDSMKHYGRVNAVAFAPDGRTILTGSVDKARVWDAKTGKPLSEYPHSAEILAVAFAPDGQSVLTGSDDKTARLWRVYPTATHESDRLRLSVEVRTGFYLDSDGVRCVLNRQKWLERKQALDELGGFCDARSWHQVTDAEKNELRTPKSP